MSGGVMATMGIVADGAGVIRAGADRSDLRRPNREWPDLRSGHFVCCGGTVARSCTWQRAPSSKVLAQVGGGNLRGAPHVEWRNEPPILVHQIDDRGVVHGVVVAFERYLLVIDPIGFRHRRQGSGIAGEPAYV